MPKHQIIHVELSSRNHEETGKFYHDLFGWEVRQIPEMSYATFSPGEGAVGGGFSPISPEYPAGTIMVYIETDDIQASLKKVEELGGKVISPPMNIPGVGDFAIFEDLSGNQVAVLQPVMNQ
jgi:predicted enzyme related to lactoylglutathione lyase